MAHIPEVRVEQRRFGANQVAIDDDEMGRVDADEGRGERVLPPTSDKSHERSPSIKPPSQLSFIGYSLAYNRPGMRLCLSMSVGGSL